jgi:hypothetical protein
MRKFVTTSVLIVKKPSLKEVILETMCLQFMKTFVPTYVHIVTNLSQVYVIYEGMHG